METSEPTQQPSINPPAVLYKYVGCEPHHINILRNLRIRFTQPDELNDPFDCIPGIEPPSDLVAFVEKAVNAADPSDPIHNLISKLSPQQFSEAKRKLVRHYESNIEALTQRCLEIVRARVNKVGILSLSARNDSLPMWNHYSAGRRGFTIEFRSGHGPLTKRPNEHFDGEGELRPVNYIESRVVATADRIDSTPFDILFTKTVDWSYEEEWRVVRELEKCDIALPQSPGQSQIFLCKIDPAAIKRVYAGEMASEEMVSSLAEAIGDGSRLEHVELLRVGMNAGRTSFSFTRIR